MHIAGESANTIASALGASRATVYVSWPRTELAATFRSDTARPNPPRTAPRAGRQALGLSAQTEHCFVAIDNVDIEMNSHATAACGVQPLQERLG